MRNTRSKSPRPSSARDGLSEREREGEERWKWGGGGQKKDGQGGTREGRGRGGGGDRGRRTGSDVGGWVGVHMCAYVCARASMPLSVCVRACSAWARARARHPCRAWRGGGGRSRSPGSRGTAPGSAASPRPLPPAPNRTAHCLAKRAKPGRAMGLSHCAARRWVEPGRAGPGRAGRVADLSVTIKHTRLTPPPNPTAVASAHRRGVRV